MSLTGVRFGGHVMTSAAAQHHRPDPGRRSEMNSPLKGAKRLEPDSTGSRIKQEQEPE